MCAELERFANEEYPTVVAAVRLITGDRAGAEDSVQDAVVQYLGAPPRVPVRNLAAWVTVVACNRSRDRMRRVQAEHRAVERLGAVPVAYHDRLGLDVVAALATLSRQQRVVCVLYYLMDRPITEIASAMGVSDGTVKTQLHRARRTLAVRLAYLRPDRAQPHPAIGQLA